MVIFLAGLIGVVLLNSKTARAGEFFPDYMAKETTGAVNGLFTLLVFLSHAVPYISLGEPFDAPYLSFRNYLGQLIVVPFLFYSGYGILESIKSKGMPYVKAIPFRRFFRVFLHMALAVLLYIGLNMALGKKMNPLDILLAFPGWTSIGNSSWYVFAILSLYLITFVSFLLARGNVYAGTVLTTLLSILFVFWQMRIGREEWTYNTAILFSAGMVFSLIKPFFEKLVAKNDAFYFSFLACLLILYLFFDARHNRGIKYYSLWGILFMMLIVTLSMKFISGSHILRWFGSHVFSFYILQRIPFLLLSRFGYQNSPVFFVAISFLFTISLSALFDFVTDKLDRLIVVSG